MKIKNILIGAISLSLITSYPATCFTGLEKNFFIQTYAVKTTDLLNQTCTTDFGSINYSVIDDKVIINKYQFSVESISEFTVPSEIDGYPVTEIGDYAFAYANNVEGIIVPECIEKIGYNSFNNGYKADLKWVCIQNANLIFPEDSNPFGSYITILGKENSTVQPLAYKYRLNFHNYEKIVRNGIFTGEIIDGTIMITDCDTEVSEAVIPEEINGMPVTAIKQNAFYDCLKLQSVYIPDSVKRIDDYTFNWCTQLTEVRLPENLTEIPIRCFNSCSSLVKIDIPETVTVINEGAFSGCTSLESIELPENITYIGANAFLSTPYIAKCTNENNLAIVNGFLQDGQGFEGENLVIPDGVKHISAGAFSNNENIKTVTIPNSVKTIENYCFRGCTNLSTVSFPDALEKIGDEAFSGCISLNNIVLPESLTYIGYNTFGECTSLTEIDIPDKIVDISPNCFKNCSLLKTIHLPDNLKSIGYSAFADCINLEDIDIPVSVETIDNYAFGKCSKIESLILPDSIKTISRDAFFNCSSLSEISFPQGKDFDLCRSSFEGTMWLENQRNEKLLIIINNMVLDGTQCTGDIFIPDGVTRICGKAFEDSKITSISLPNSVQKFGSGAFFGCKNLTEFTIPDGVTEIATSMFSSCSSLTKVNIPESVKTINGGAFSFCDGFKEFTVPKNIESVGQAFDYCENLKTITFQNHDCFIAGDSDNFLFMPMNTTVRGYADSTAYWFAYINNRKFEEIYEIGDANADTIFNITDVTILQKWLLNDDTDLKSWKAIDMDNNEILNIFDLIMIKRKLLNE